MNKSVNVIDIGNKIINENNRLLINTWVSKNWVKDTQPKSIYIKYDSLLSKIKETYDNSESRRAHLTALMNAVSTHSRTLKNKTLAYKRITDLSEEATSIGRVINENRAQNHPSGKYISLLAMAKIRNSLIDQFYKKTTSIQDHQRVLLASLNTLQGPLRSEDVVNIQFTRTKPTEFKQKENYLWRDTSGWRYYLSLQKGREGKKDRDIKIDSKLTPLLDYSHETFPRKYLYQNHINGDQPISTHLYLNLIKLTFGNEMDTRGMRHAYGSYYVNQPKSKVSQADLLRIANEMGTNISTLMSNYTEAIPSSELVDLPPPNFQNVKVDKTISQVLPTNPKVKTNLQTKKAEKMRAYNEEHRDEINKASKERRQDEKKVWADQQKRHILDIQRGKPKKESTIIKFELEKYIGRDLG